MCLYVKFLNSEEIMKIEKETDKIKNIVSAEMSRTGGIFKLAPAWVGRPGIIFPGNRLKLNDIYICRDVAVNERWLASVTYAENGIYNKVCPPDHGLSYVITGDTKFLLKDAIKAEEDIILGENKKWDVLSKFFDNRNRIPNHLHPCDNHAAKGLKGKPESYYFPEELNINRNDFPLSYFGVDPYFSDRQILNYLNNFFKGDNRLTDISNGINLIPGTGYYMPPCTLHAPGSLVTYELQAASDITCIPESRVNDLVMPDDLIDVHIPVSIKEDGMKKTFEYILEMLRCPDSGNGENFRMEYFRPPVEIFSSAEGEQHFTIYRTGKAGCDKNNDYYSSKRTTVYSGKTLQLSENAAFGLIVLRGTGKVCVPGNKSVYIESASMFASRDNAGADEMFICYDAAKKVEFTNTGVEPLSFLQHFASDSNPYAAGLEVPEFLIFQ